MIKLKHIEWQGKHAHYAYEWQGYGNVLFVGPGEGSYETGWTAIMVGKFDKWSTLEKHVYMMKHEDGQWYSASDVFKDRGPRQPIPRMSKSESCLCHFFDTVYQTWLNDLIMLEETSPGSDGA